jgi:putative transposase
MRTYSCSTKVVLLPPVEPGQFRSRKHVLALQQAGLAGSMGRVAACADNAAMESFFSLLQKNVLNRKRWDTREQLRLAIVLDRADLPPPPTTGRPRAADSRRV